MSISRLTPDSTGRGRTAGGLALALVSAASFGTSGSFAGSLMAAGWSPGAVVTARIAIAALVLSVPAAVVMRGRWALLRAGAGAAVLYGVLAVAGCQLAFFYAVQRLDVGIALLLEYSGIVLVVLWGWLRHGRRPRRTTALGSAAALAGLVAVLNPSTGGGLDPVGVLWGLVAATGLATYFLVSARADTSVPPLGIAWAGMVVGALVLLAAGAAGVMPVVVGGADVALAGAAMHAAVPVAGLALLAAAVSYTAGIGAARLLGATVASFVGLTEVLFGVLFAALLLGQVPTVVQLLGGLVVIAGVALVQGDADRPAAAPAAEPLPEAGRREPVR